MEVERNLRAVPDLKWMKFHLTAVESYNPYRDSIDPMEAEGCLIDLDSMIDLQAAIRD